MCRFVPSVKQAVPDAVMEALPLQTAQPAVKASTAPSISDSPLDGAVPCVTDTQAMHVKSSKQHMDTGRAGCTV